MHHGHLRLAIELREQLDLAEVRIVPCGEPAHRTVPGVSARRRLHWAQLSVGDDRGLVVDPREVQRSGASFTHDTLSALRAELGVTVPLVLLLGDDAANGFHTWHRWREILTLAHLVFVERPYEPLTPAPELAAFLRGRRASTITDLHARPAGLWLSTSIPPLAISSTRIRQLLAAGCSVRGLVSESVLRDLTSEDIRLLTYNDDTAYDPLQR